MVCRASVGFRHSGGEQLTFEYDFETASVAPFVMMVRRRTG